MTQRSSGKWVRCQPGEFQRLAQRLSKRRQRRRFLVSASAAAAAVTVTLGSALGMWVWWRAGNQSQPPTEILGCTQVRAHAPAYGKGELSASVRDQIRRHLAYCAPCREYYKSLGLQTHNPSPSDEPTAQATVAPAKGGKHAQSG